MSVSVVTVPTGTERQGWAMALMTSRTIATSIERDPQDVYDFVTDPANLPRWAPGFATSVHHSDGHWTVETPDGPVRVEFVSRNALGVADHRVSTPSGPDAVVHLRVIANDGGAEVLFTTFRPTAMSDERFAADAALVQGDMRTLKVLLEPDGS